MSITSLTRSQKYRNYSKRLYHKQRINRNLFRKAGKRKKYTKYPFMVRYSHRKYNHKKNSSTLKRRLSWMIGILLIFLCILKCYQMIAVDEFGNKIYHRDVTFQTIESAMDFLQECLPAEEKSEPQPLDTNIRVVIKTNQFKDIFHSQVTIGSNADYLVTSAGETQVIACQCAIDITPGSLYFKDDKIKIEPAAGNEIVISSLDRNRGKPFYEGSIEINRTPSGLVIVNELTVEQYLYRVVPSEMPESYGMEALKAQAICARSYAYRQMQSQGYPEYDADVDDSVSYQVYNNCDKTQMSVAAVDQTAGIAAVYQDKIIDAYFFSTSCGHTTDWKVWGAESEYKEYLQGVYLDGNAEKKNLDSDAAFADYLKNEQNTFDSNSPWYRWRAELDFNKLSDTWKNKLGKIKGMTVRERGCGGIVLSLEINGESESVELNTEYDIREFLAPLITCITKADDSKTSQMSLLPSAFFCISNENYPTVELCGGGYGHGAGMSQNAAKGMAEAGWTYDTILKYFYHGIELKPINTISK